MDTLFLLLLTLGMALGVIAFRNGSNSNLFTFPFLFPAVTIAFVLVEFADYMRNAGIVYQLFADSGAVTIALFMIASSSLFGLLGHSFGSRGARRLDFAPKNLQPPSPRAVATMHIASIIIGGISFGAFIALSNLAGGVQQYVFESGGYSLEWRGLPVYLVFLVQFCYISIAIQLWLWVRTKRKKHLAFAIFFSIIPLINILFIFRRSDVLKLGVLYGYFLTTYRYVKIGRVSAFAGLIGMYLVLRIFPLLRGQSDWGLGSVGLNEALGRETYQDSEIGSGLLRIYQSMQAGTFEYGAIFYNAIIGQFVPGGLVGADFKNALMLPTISYTDLDFAVFKFYVSPMGFAQAYQQFWLLGGLIFFVIGWIMAKIEKDRFKSARHELLLLLIIPASVGAVSADLSYFLPQIIIVIATLMISVPKDRHIPRSAEIRSRSPVHT